jgi:hypothetical protein
MMQESLLNDAAELLNITSFDHGLLALGRGTASITNNFGLDGGFIQFPISS